MYPSIMGYIVTLYLSIGNWHCQSHIAIKITYLLTSAFNYHFNLLIVFLNVRYILLITTS